MKNIIPIIVITLTSLYSCSNTTQAVEAKKNTPTQPKVVSPTYDVLISFISKGEGINDELKNKIDLIIITFNEKNKTTVAPEIISWGREGELDYGFLTKNLSTNQKRTLTSQIKEAIGSSDLVRISFNQKSVHKR